MFRWQKRLQRELQGWPDELITGALLTAAAILLIVALMPDHGIFKAAVLAWVVFP